MTVSRADLEATLERAKARGFLGPGDVQSHLDHALDFSVAAAPFRGTFLDLGTGAGLPGLVLALEWPETHGLLVDSSVRRGEALDEACRILELEGRITVLVARAEALGRNPDHRGRHGLIVARSFGAPAVLAECAAPLLAVGGHAVISEVADETSRERRWSTEGLAEFGLERLETRSFGTATVSVLVKTTETGERWPRRVGIPSKRPRWR